MISQDEGDVKIVGIGEVEGAIYKADGIDIHDLIRFRKETGSILNYPGAVNFGKEDREKVLEFDCDILVPAALENAIHEGNAPRVKAKIIAEAANGPLTAGAEKILLERGTLILPDLFLNAGGVTVSYFEWLKNLSHTRFGRLEKRFNQRTYDNLISYIEKTTQKKVDDFERTLIARGADEIDLVRSGLEETMINAYNSVRDVKLKKNIKDYRTAAFVCAIEKIADDYSALGIFP
jgi:glutamate dehydrogenase (NAD(P)+)